MAMSKIEANETGRREGRAFAETINETLLRTFADDNGKVRDVIAGQAIVMARANCLKYGSVNDAEYRKGFTSVAIGFSWNKYRELPDVAAAFEEKGYLYVVDRMLDDAKTTLDRFAKRFASDPLDAFSWSLDAFQAAADLDRATFAKALLVAGKTSEEVKQKFLLDARHMVRLDGFTSPMSNLAEQAKAIATLRLAGVR